MHRIAAWIVGLLLAWSLPAGAQSLSPPVSPLTAIQQRQLETLNDMLSLDSVSWNHPDLRYRNLGMEAYKQGDKDRALRFFIEASRYADKASQALVAVIYWTGDGTAVDRPRAYAWMDLAASMGYHDLLVQREAYWQQLSEQERATALEVGKAIYDEYGDDKGIRRLKGQMAMVASGVTGSHAGFVGNGTVVMPGVGPDISSLGALNGANVGTVLDMSRFQRLNLMDIHDYLWMKDTEWSLKSPLHPQVKVGGPEQVPKPG